MRFVIDMNLSPKWVDQLSRSGLEAEHWSKIGAPNARDPEIMAFARENGWVVLTNDLDFGSILAATGGDAPSVVQIRSNDCRVDAIGHFVVDAIRLALVQLTEGALVTIDATRMRITTLPIKARH